MARIPPMFVSHGAPTLAIEDSPARHFLEGLADTLPRPRAIVAVSAHWGTRDPTVNAVAVNETIHDFRGFPDELYKIRYPAPGSPLVAGEVAELLDDAGFECGVDEERGLDHGAWVPLSLIYPDAHVPVVQLSVQSHLGPRHHYHVGRALEPLTRDDVLVLGSGSFTHDLSSFRSATDDEPEWVRSFAQWIRRFSTIALATCSLTIGWRLTPSGTIRPKSICCRCSWRSERPVNTPKPSISIPALATACCAWMPTSLSRLYEPYR